jgi:probable F420-dependent oxidoreductase
VVLRIVAPGGAGEGATEHRSERTSRCVSEERKPQRAPAPSRATPKCPLRLGWVHQAVQVARAVELDEGLAPTARADLAVGHDGVPGERPAVGRAPGQFALVDRGSDPRHDAGAPLRVPHAVVPAVHGRARQLHTTERDVAQREADMAARHHPTVPVQRETPRRRRPVTIAAVSPLRPFRFLGAFQAIADGATLADTARRAEATGFSALVIPDHLILQLSPMPALAAIAAATRTLRIGTFVINNDLRHPAVLAQDLASLDVLSDGRLEIGIGAGWNRDEYDAIGLPFEPASIRQARLAEAVAVLKGAFADGRFSFRGDYYTIDDYDGWPKPVQQPHPPLMIGGGGRRTLTLAAREADIVGFAPRILPGDRTDPHSLTWAATEEKLAWVREAAGPRFDALELNVYPSRWPIVVTDDARGEAARASEALRERSGVELTVDEVLASPHLFIGSIDGLVAKFTELRERLGISSFMVGAVDELAPVVERLAGT